MKKNNDHLYHPRYWPVWCAAFVLWLITKTLPYKALLSLGKAAGLLMFAFDKKQRHITDVNINLCFPGLNTKDKQQRIRESFIALGIGVFEAGLGWWGSDKKLRDLGHFQGIEHLISARENEKGLLLFGVHFTTLELAGRLLRLRDIDFVIIYRAHKNPVLNYLLEKNRRRHYPLAIERSNVRGILKALKKNKIVWYTPDIDAGYYDHIFAPFFGVPAASLTATARLAAITGAQTALSTYYRRDDKTGYDIYFSPVLEHFPTHDLMDNITRINQLIENAIRKKPEQYLWQYKRFKTRPSGEKRFY